MSFGFVCLELFLNRILVLFEKIFFILFKNVIKTHNFNRLSIFELCIRLFNVKNISFKFRS